MEITVTDGIVYLVAIFLLMAVQIYQQTLIRKNRKELDTLWEQVGTVVFGISTKIVDMDKELTKKEDKK